MLTFEQVNEASADSARMLKTIQRCTHCGEETTKHSLYCLYCRNSKDRQEMCQENKLINLKWSCKLCKI